MYLLKDDELGKLIREEPIVVALFCKYISQNIVLFKSLRNSKRCNKGNFTLKSNSNKIMLCGGGGQPYLVLIRLQRNIFIFKSLYNFLRELNDIFYVKIYFLCQINSR